ncbi:MAG: LysR family transcriptional regulator [Myxococcales bacterium]|nr:LysR family transcriptional regulator [Myxococcales bacterium]
MTLEDLRVFAAVCKAHSLSAVARELGCTQPAVGQHVARLERELNVSLLNRRARGVTVTPAGEVLHRAAVDALGALAAATRMVGDIREGKSGSLLITTGTTTVRHFMQAAVVNFRQRFPGVSLEFRPGNSTRQCLELLRRDPIDLAFVTTAVPVQGLEQRPVIEARHMLLVPKDHELAGRRRLRIAELKGLPFVGLRSYTSPDSRLAKQLADGGVVIRAKTMVDDWDNAGMMVELGVGLAIVPSIHAHSFVKSGNLAAVRIGGLSPILFGWTARDFERLSKAALHFMALVDAELSSANDMDGCRYLG